MLASERLLKGKRILVTRAKEQASSFSKKIQSLGGVPIEIPLIKIEAPSNTDQIEKTLINLHTYDWLVFTSVNGVHYFFQFLEQFDIPIKNTQEKPKIAVVGKKTLEALEKKGVKVDLIPDEFVAEDLLTKMLLQVKKGDNVLLARGNLARSLLPEKLKEAGARVNDLVVYETVVNMEARAELLEILKLRSCDLIAFTSSSTVTNFCSLLKGADIEALLKNIKIACIGPITEQTALESGLKVDIVAKEYTIDGLLEAIVRSFDDGDENGRNIDE